MGLTQMLPSAMRSLADLRRPATDEEIAAYERALHPGAPADFAGMVLPNPNGIKVSDDTDSGIEPLRLPNGVTLQRGNFSGKTPFDVSNPPHTQMTTAGAETTGKPLFDMTKAEPIAGSGKPLFDMSKAEPIEKKESEPGFWDTLQREGKALTGSIAGMPAAVYHAFVEPATAEEKQKFGGEDQVTGAKRVGLGLHRLTTAPVETAAQWYTDALKGKIPNAYEQALSVAPEAMGSAAGNVIGGKVLESGISAAPKVVDAAASAAAGVKPALATVGKVATDVGHSLDPDLVGLVSPRAAHALRLANKVGKVATKLGAEPEVPVNPGAPLPAQPLPEQLNPALVSPARTLPGMHSPEVIAPPAAAAPTPAVPIPARAGLQLAGEVADPFKAASQTATAAAEKMTQAAEATAETPAPAPKKYSLADLDKPLNDALGGKPLQKGVPLRSQAAGGASAKTADLPDGYTPTKSSVLAGYKYDPANETIHAITNSGQHYAHAGVSPEQFEAFEEAPSQGKAWNDLRKAPGVVQVEKNFQPSKPGTITTETGEVIPKSKAGMISDPLAAKVQNLKDFMKPAAAATKAPTLSDLASPNEGDLTSLLQKSLDQAKAAKAEKGVTTTAVPKTLLDRWGVDQKSIAATDDNLRGMSPKESEAYIDKLVESYKNGTKVEPVLETRDADNNIVDVDGRHRALAAHKAGIERIPIIVRRLGATAKTLKDLEARPQ